MASWYEPLRAVVSLGSQTGRPGSLANLAEARRVHLGQFFTPDAVASFVWRLVEPAINRALAINNERVWLFDNSVGSGRLLQFADPAKHALAGLDTHEPAVSALIQAAEASGFHCELAVAGMEAARPQGYNVGLINPPFSLHLEAPTLEPYPCTTWGRYGPHTSALSHAYALAQALDACQIVAAILPAGFAAEVACDPGATLGEDGARLRAHIELPAGSFREEGTEVGTALLVFDSCAPGGCDTYKASSLEEEIPDLGLYICNKYRSKRLNVIGIDDEGPVINRPVTGDNTVRVTHNGRKIGLRFACGLIEAKVMNAVMRDRIEAYQDRDNHHRYPKGVRYTGQAVLDVETHLAQDDPLASFNAFLDCIRDAGGTPQVDAGLMGYLKKRTRAVQREKTPFRHVVWTDVGSGGFEATAKNTHVADPKVWGSPVIVAGERIHFTPTHNKRYRYTIDNQSYELPLEEVRRRFNFTASPESGWQVIHEGLCHAFPDLAHALRARARLLGMDQWLWPYQGEDAVETLLKPKGAVDAWEMGLGKARLAVALILLSGVKHGLIATDSYLVPEMVGEMQKLPIDNACWQVVDRADKLQNLRTINVISYNRLRMAISPACPNKTYAKYLRRKIGLLVADEADIVANDTDQTKALWQLSARRRFCLTGTPIGNYPRNTLPLMQFAVGDGTAAQPYGRRRAYLTPQIRISLAWASRGIDSFRDRFTTFEWVTNQFAEDMSKGAKREIPKIANLQEYRSVISPHIKRRLAKEPEVAPFVKIKDPVEIITEAAWDIEHLGFYLKTADEFAEWYRKAHKDKGNQINLVTILARIGAVRMAANYPQHGIKGIGSYHALTSKQRLAVERLESLTGEGHKSVLFAQNPGLLDILENELLARGIECVVFHGNIPIKQRTGNLNARFRYGPAPVLLATYGVAKRGLNLYQADRVLLYDRDWSAKTEDQSIRRLCRPQQTQDVVAERLHLPGSIDIYQGQMVAFKRDAANSGLDWASPEMDDVDFLHIDTLLGRFCEDLAKLHQVPQHELRKMMKTMKEVKYASAA